MRAILLQIPSEAAGVELFKNMFDKSYFFNPSPYLDMLYYSILKLFGWFEPSKK